MPTPDQLFERYATALGGAEAIAKVQARTLKGTVTNYAHVDEVHPERAPTLVTPYEVLAKGPDRRMTVQHNIAADVVTTYAAGELDEERRMRRRPISDPTSSKSPGSRTPSCSRPSSSSCSPTSR